MPITINGSGTVTGLAVGGLPDGIVDTDMLAADAVTAAKAHIAGSILQVQVGTVDTQSEQTTSGTDAYTVISQAITPKATSSKILIMSELYGNISGNYNGLGLLLYRDSSNIGVAAANGSVARFNAAWQGPTVTDRVTLATVFHLDSPSSTSEITYYIKAQDANGDGGEFAVNRASNWGQNTSHCATASHIILMEVAG